MSLALRARKPLALLTVGLAVSAGLALSPFGLAAANASNSTSAGTIIKDVNSFRASNEVGPLSQNKFLASYAQDEANYAAKHSTVHVSLSKSTLPFPENPVAPSDNELSVNGTAKVPHGSAASVYKFLKSQISDSFTDSTQNYIAVGYAKHGSTVYASILVLQYSQAPLDLITESKPTISGTAKVGATLTAKPSFSPAADASSLTYAWKTGTTLLGSASTYVVQTTDYTHKITLTVTGSKSGYVGKDDTTATLTATSSSSKAVAKGTITKGAVEVEGSRTVGSQLTATPDGWAPETVVFSYKWLRDGKSIKGAAAVDTYTQVAADKGHKINVEVTATSPDYTTTSKTTTSTTKTVTPAG